mmetsp:Transcript_4773/g.7189  ORF Transcript_4773/g.7189 Transcript_4773/m.7189 type:complete len:222 (+) Transcript_4773:31-696(+)|eukprot:CAMPEP_0201548728 /NCGR_PEP_ID=MMETSP0173_2-20130828/5249_1 /ASSEMBLY_ACC=CAM_ASM_000268 /TAXON_ID=218659 /ORGANISM="Vexillifera sp., Strain DIVA3 564/2" /LENGTH=221 /DNA_ID=CAMNT_0047958189 /DNA_START=54 /DNA_END=719 /DNA_ORIENTATION=-
MSSSIVKRGLFVLFEGIDRTGKTTQSLKLVEALREAGHRVKHLRFPDRTTQTGKLCDEYLREATTLSDECVHLLFSANRWEQAAEMRRLLNTGTSLVVDRYAYSGVAFSAAKGNLSLAWCKSPDAGLPAPDLVLFLSLTIEQAKLRGEYGAERYEKEAFQRKVRKIYDALAEEAHKDDAICWKEIDANTSVDQLHETILKLVKEKVKEIQSKPTKVHTLWQ